MRNLKQLDVAFVGAKSTNSATYYSKLAILELCGWIEISMDDIVLTHLKRNIRDGKNKRHIEGIVKKNSGFDYNYNFRSMLISLIGIITCEKLELCVNQSIHAKFNAQLENLKTVRNSLAHTYLKNHQIIALDAPSVTRARFQDIYDGLIEYQTILKQI